MQSRIIYLLRHCESHFPGEQERRYLGQTDIPLNDKGIRSAEYIGLFFRGIIFDALYSSDLERARDTAEIICAVSGNNRKVKTLKDLREINLGSWEGKPMAQIKEQFPEEYEKRGKYIASYRPPGGESFMDLSGRAYSALSEIVKEARGNILICSHAGTNRTILCRLLGLPLRNLFRIPQDYGGINILIYKNQLCASTINFLIGKGGMIKSNR